MMRWLWKALVCSWRHRKHRCYPAVWEEDERIWRKLWHCMKCHPCGEGLEKLLNAKHRRGNVQS